MFSCQCVCVCVCVCVPVRVQGHCVCVCVSAWLFICWMHVEYVYVLESGHSQISIYMQIVHPVSNSHVCLLGVDGMCSMQSSSAHQEWAKPSRAESGAVLFHHHPHCGNVKPRGHCQSSQFCYLLGSQPARDWGSVGRGGWRGRRPFFFFLKSAKEIVTQSKGVEEEPRNSCCSSALTTDTVFAQVKEIY